MYESDDGEASSCNRRDTQEEFSQSSDYSGFFLEECGDGVDEDCESDCSSEDFQERVDNKFCW